MERKSFIPIYIQEISPNPDNYCLMPLDDDSNLQKLIIEGLLNTKSRYSFSSLTPLDQEELIKTTSLLASTIIGSTKNLWNHYLWPDLWDEMNVDYPEYMDAIPSGWRGLVRNGLHNFFDMKQTHSNSMAELWQKKHMVKNGESVSSENGVSRHTHQKPASAPFHS